MPESPGSDCTAEKPHKVRQALLHIQQWLCLVFAASLPVSLTASWVVLTIGLILLALELIWQPHQLAIFTKPRVNKIAAGIALLSLIAMFSGAINSSPTYGRFGSAWFMEAIQSAVALKALLAFFWSARIFSQSRATAAKAIGILIATAAVAGLWGSIQQIFNFHPFGYKYLQGTGFHGGPMAFAGQMQLFSLLAAAVALKNGLQTGPADSPSFRIAWLKKPVFLWILVALNLAGVLFAGERNAWLGEAAGIAVLALFMPRQLIWGMSVLLALAGSLLWTMVPLVRTRIESLFSGQDISIISRIKIWTECLHNYFPQSPLFGVGIRRFPHFSLPEAIVPGISVDLNHAHSNYIHILTCLGIAGLFAFGVLWLLVLWACQQLYREGRQNKDTLAQATAVGLLAGTVALMISGIFEYNFGTAHVRLAQWFLLGLVALPVLPAAHDTHSNERESKI